MLKKLARPLLRRPLLNRIATDAAYGLGAVRTSRRISAHTGYVPDIVPIEIPPEYRPDRRLRMHSGAGLDQVARSIWRGGWDGFEAPMPSVFAALAATGVRGVLDIGSYSGFYSLIAAACAPAARVYAFDPYPTAQRLIRANLALNQFAGRVELVCAAVSEAPGAAELYVPTTETGLIESASSLNRDHRGEHLETHHVEVVSVDSFVRSRDVRAVDLVKIDVEQHEGKVLAGAAETVRTRQPWIFVEVLSPEIAEAVEAFRRAAGYACAVLSEPGLKWAERVTADPAATNQLLVPPARYEATRALASG